MISNGKFIDKPVDFVYIYVFFSVCVCVYV